MKGGIYTDEELVKASDLVYFMKLEDNSLTYHSKMNYPRCIKN